MEIKICYDSKTPIYLQIKNTIKEKILSGELVNGFKLPAERTLAGQLHVHRNTVIKAYENLISENLVVSSISPRGYFITYEWPQFLDGKAGKWKNRQQTPLNYMIRDEFLQMDSLFDKLFNTGGNEEVISFAQDVISPNMYPKQQLSEILIDLAQSNKYDLYGFCEAQGSKEFRTCLAHMLEDRQIRVSHKQIQVVSETYEALDYIAKLYVSPGDTIVAEEPILSDVFQLFQFMGVNVVTIPMDKDGMRTEYLEGIIRKYKPKFIYTIPTFHYPSTAVMSLSRRYELLSIAYRYDIPIIEEDCDSILRCEGAVIPTLKALDKGEHVIYINAFIGTVCPGVRIAYIVAPEQTVKKTGKLLGLNQMFTNPIGQYLTCEFIKRGFFEKHVELLSQYARGKRDLMCEIINERKELKLKFEIPKGGTSLWCELEENISPQKLLYHAMKRGVCYMPGHLFFPYGNQGENFLRLCYGNSSDDQIEEGLFKLEKAIVDSR